jgi:hypothetical protein
MKMVEIPLNALTTSAEYWRDEQARYAEMGDTFADLEAWCGIRADVYETILELWGK